MTKRAKSQVLSVKSKENKKAGSRKKKAESLLTAEVLNLTGGKTHITLPEKIFKVSVKPETLAQAVRVYLTNQRAGTAKTLTRGEVRGGGRKPWRQKGTGRARQGSIRAPHWRGGGVVFGPTPRDFYAKLPKKVRKKALFGAISEKFTEDAVKIVDNFEKITPKTKELVKALEKLNLPRDKKILWVVNGESENLRKAGRNLPFLSFCKVSNLTTYQVMASPILVFSKNAIAELEKKVE